MKNIQSFDEFLNESTDLSSVHANIADEHLENITISLQNWRNVLDFIKCDPYISMSDPKKGWNFNGDRAAVWTSNNPINGEDFKKKNRGPIKPGFAGDIYIYGLGDKDLARDIADMIKH